jgi:hypothetical protein
MHKFMLQFWLNIVMPRASNGNKLWHNRHNPTTCMADSKHRRHRESRSRMAKCGLWSRDVPGPDQVWTERPTAHVNANGANKADL